MRSSRPWYARDCGEGSFAELAALLRCRLLGGYVHAAHAHTHTDGHTPFSGVSSADPLKSPELRALWYITFDFGRQSLTSFRGSAGWRGRCQVNETHNIHTQHTQTGRPSTNFQEQRSSSTLGRVSFAEPQDSTLFWPATDHFSSSVSWFSAADATVVKFKKRTHTHAR